MVLLLVALTDTLSLTPTRLLRTCACTSGAATLRATVAATATLPPWAAKPSDAPTAVLVSVLVSSASTLTCCSWAPWPARRLLFSSTALTSPSISLCAKEAPTEMARPCAVPDSAAPTALALRVAWLLALTVRLSATRWFGCCGCRFLTSARV
ncbi:Uncharacterised protein [Bordetella trematum]|nr:Uncharacterised protein [Bordetella trematum]